MIYVPLISTILIAGWHEALKSTNLYTYETAILVIACIQGIKADRKGEK